MTARPSRAPSACPAWAPRPSAFNQIGNEVHPAPAHHHRPRQGDDGVASPARAGNWRPAARPRPVPRSRRRSRSTCTATARATPRPARSSRGRLIKTVTKTFSIRYRPSSQSRRRVPLHGQGRRSCTTGSRRRSRSPSTATSPMTWCGRSATTRTPAGCTPLGPPRPMNDLNVGLSPAARIGHDRFPDSIIWDTRAAGLSRRRRRSCRASSTWTGRLGRLRAGCALHRSLTKTSPTGEVPPAMAARR